MNRCPCPRALMREMRRGNVRARPMRGQWVVCAEQPPWQWGTPAPSCAGTRARRNLQRTHHGAPRHLLTPLVLVPVRMWRGTIIVCTQRGSVAGQNTSARCPGASSTKRRPRGERHGEVCGVS